MSTFWRIFAGFAGLSHILMAIAVMVEMRTVDAAKRRDWIVLSLVVWVVLLALSAALRALTFALTGVET